jgi:hypothetical protein
MPCPTQWRRARVYIFHPEVCSHRFSAKVFHIHAAMPENVGLENLYPYAQSLGILL